MSNYINIINNNILYQHIHKLNLKFTDTLRIAEYNKGFYIPEINDKNIVNIRKWAVLLHTHGNTFTD